MLNSRQLRELVKREGLPLPTSSVRRIYVFGSSLVKEDWNDVDIALFISPWNEVFKDVLQVYSCQFGVIEYHLIPDLGWYRKRFKDSSDRRLRLWKFPSLARLEVA